MQFFILNFLKHIFKWNLFIQNFLYFTFYKLDNFFILTLNINLIDIFWLGLVVLGPVLAASCATELPVPVPPAFFFKTPVKSCSIKKAAKKSSINVVYKHSITIRNNRLIKILTSCNCFLSKIRIKFMITLVVLCSNVQPWRAEQEQLKVNLKNLINTNKEHR